MRKTVLLSLSTKERLDRLKKSKSYDAFLASVADYFEVTGASLDAPTPINRYITEQASRVIEVVRGIEKKQNLLLKSIAERLEEAPNLHPPAESIFSDKELAQVEEVVKKNKDLECHLESLRAELRAEQEKNIFSQAVQASVSEAIDVEQIRELLAKLRGKCGTIPLDNSKYSIPKSDLEAILSEIKQLLY